MEQILQESISNILAQPGVVGVLSADGNGLCLNAQGNAPAAASGFGRSLAVRAKQLAGNGHPIVVVETDSTNIFIKEHDNITTAVYKII